MFKIIIRGTKKSRLAKEGTVANIVEPQEQTFNKEGTKEADIVTRAIQQTQVNPKYNKNTTLITRLSSPHIWEQHEVPVII